MRGIKGLEQPAPERLIYPVQTKIASLSPSFRWDISNAKGPYEFELLAPGADKPIYRTKTTAGTLKLPASVKLLPDTTYTWSIGADGHALGTGSFTSLSSAALDMVKLRKPADTADFSDRLMYGVMLHDLGATQDAQEIWLKLAAERADRPELSSWSK
jgi:hypothetical protein